MQFRISDEETLEYYVRQDLPIQIGYEEVGKRKVRYVYSGNDEGKPLYVFIHGAPSSSNYYANYLADTSLRRMANLVAVDRLGYGYSDFGNPEPQLEQQAAAVHAVVKRLHAEDRPVVLVGASYGSTIACRLAMDYPDLADGIILIAPSLAAGEEKTYFISYVLETPFFSWAQPRIVHLANVEKFAHEAELKKMEKRWGEIKVPIMYMQGKADELIYPSNAVFAKKHLVNAASLDIDLIPDRGHLLIEVERPRILKALKGMKQKAANYFSGIRAAQLNPDLNLSDRLAP